MTAATIFVIVIIYGGGPSRTNLTFATREACERGIADMHKASIFAGSMACLELLSPPSKEKPE